MAKSKIYLGDTNIGSIFGGAADVSIYLGTEKVYPLEKKLIATYSDTSTYEIYCNSNGILSSGETKPSGYEYSAMTDATIGGCVTSIDTAAFKNCTSLSSCTIGSGVTSIMTGAFSNCKSLSSVDIPNSVTNIGSATFYYCNGLTSINIPSGVTSIDSQTFSYCSGLTSMDIPNGVTTIGNDVFLRCYGLTSIVIPDSVTTIGGSAFMYCTGLTDVIIGSGITNIAIQSFFGCNSLTSITVNATIPPTIGTNALLNTNNCPIYVPCESVDAYKAASGWSEYASRITCIESPSSCYEVISTPITSYTSTTYDSVYSFTDAKWYMKNNLSQYEEYGIYDFGSSLSDFTYYDGKLGVVGETEYQYSGGSWNIVGSYVDSSVTYTIDDTYPSPYGGQELSTTFKIPYADVESIRFISFSIRDDNDGELEIMLDSGGGMAEYNYRNSEWNEYSGEITEDGEYFYLSLPSEAPQSIVIDSIEYRNSTPIHLIVGSKQVTVEYEEKDMPLTDVYDTVAEMETVGCPTVGVGQYGVVGNDAYQFDGEDWNSASNYKLMEKNTDGKANVLACNSSTDLVKTETQPSYFNNITYVEIGDCVTSIGNEAFYGCTGLTSIDIPSGVTTIGSNAFQNCKGLTSVEIPNTVTSIGNSTFWNCISLTSCTIGSGVTSIGTNAFVNCTGLTSITVDSNNSAYDSRNNCNALIKTNTNELILGCRNTIIPNGVTSIGNGAFSTCSDLTGNFDIPNSVTTIGANAFRVCSGLTSITIGTGISSIAMYAFYGCSSLTSITINATTPPSLNLYVFDSTNNCPIYVPSGSVETYKTTYRWSTYADRIQAIPNS